MKKSSINIKVLPTNIKNKLQELQLKELYIVGYKKILTKYKVPIVELKNFNRIWTLTKELKTKCSI